jgi:hypothetical protein
MLLSPYRIMRNIEMLSYMSILFWDSKRINELLLSKYTAMLQFALLQLYASRIFRRE